MFGKDEGPHYVDPALDVLFGEYKTHKQTAWDNQLQNGKRREQNPNHKGRYPAQNGVLSLSPPI